MKKTFCGFVMLAAVIVLLNIIPSLSSTGDITPILTPQSGSTFAEQLLQKADNLPNAEADNKEALFSELKNKASDAGYEVNETYVDSALVEVSSAFSVKISIDKNNYISIPIVLAETEAAAISNCAMYAESDSKMTVRNANIFSYMSNDLPDEVIGLINAIVNNKDIPELPYPLEW